MREKRLKKETVIGHDQYFVRSEDDLVGLANKALR